LSLLRNRERNFSKPQADADPQRIDVYRSMSAFTIEGKQFAADKID
jgi:hypothetical protein